MMLRRRLVPVAALVVAIGASAAGAATAAATGSRGATGAAYEGHKPAACKVSLPGGAGKDVAPAAAEVGALDGSVGAQRRLVADASHELRTPLTSLVTNLELLAERPDDPQAPALISEALHQARELAVLTGDLVDLARFGEAPSRSEAVRMDSMCAELAARRGAQVDPGSLAVVVRGDPAALERAVGNLVDNALKVGTRAAVSVRGRDGCAVVEVTDDGPGIPAADLPYVFDRFHRSPDARALPGSGLGLAIAKQVAESHGGRIEAVPQPVGVLLRITLPAAAAR